MNTAPIEAAPAAPTEVKAEDTPDDAGGSLTVSWQASTDESRGKVKYYQIYRATSVDGQPGAFEPLGESPAGTLQYFDGKIPVRTGFWEQVLHSTDTTAYFYKVAAVNDSTVDGKVIWQTQTESEVVGPARSSAQWFNIQRINVLVGLLLLCAFIVYYIQRAKAGKPIFIRKIAGLEAVDEAVGRATEMGRKIFYIPGSQDMDQVQTLAGITILGRVAEMAAVYDTWLEVPVSRSLVMVTCREVVKEAYARAGRPDSFKEKQVHYLTDDQFGYAAAIDGMVVREKPATIFMMGLFYAEALILAETGNFVGAIQIAGTAEPSQLPFFVAACDYTLIGEELFAASAYLSREPRQLGSLKGQDIGKGVVLAAIIIGILLETFGLFDFAKLFRVIGG
ncbi:hypothetical protein C3F09_02230 [candidate division GN15 bacterium]|uniref:DUF6754 domain-containing protein n=1 Tax=candidate division GN15 bacterium TaxID=2072418 RepID=A0A855XA11_9BACT|nr:MAG: hypothetical protein C3F09_02230 [candidate division GN15 bacterium]